MDAALVVGSKRPENAQLEIAVARPGKVHARSVSEKGVRHFYADGRQATLYDEKMKVYASTAAPGTIDGLVKLLAEKFGFAPPMAEFLVNAPYHNLRSKAVDGAHKGQEAVGGVECHRLAFTGEIADWELWVATGDQLPRRLVVTFRDGQGQPQIKAEFTNWNLSAKIADKVFSFKPPKGTEKIKIVPAGGEK
jgi:hypothetical protein